MNRAIFFSAACSALVALGGAARAQDPARGIKPRATVEVLDDRAQIDDVISRLKKKPPPAEERQAPPDGEPDADLKSARPPLPAVLPGEKKSAVPTEAKPAPWRPSQRERGSGAPERTERPRRARP